MEKNSDCDVDESEGKLVIDLGEAIPGAVSQDTTGVGTPADPAPSSKGDNQNKKSGNVTSSAKQPSVKRKASSGGSTPSDFVNRPSSPDQQHSDNNSNNSDNQSLRMKIKRKKMATRQSAARHEAALDDSQQKMDSNRNRGGSDSCGAVICEEKLERRDVGTWVRTIGSATDAECFGPCEPGTAVTLEGIVWHETTGGILVVNVTWRGKSYVGTLLDCTKSDWAAPRFCDSPNNDLDGSKTPAKGRGLKRCAGSSASLNNNRSNVNSASTSSDVQNGQQKTTNKQNESLAINLLSESCLSEITPSSGSDGPKPDPVLEPTSPLLFECPLNGCEKKYGRLTALKYHQNSAHFSMPLKRNSSGCVSKDSSNVLVLKETPATIDVKKLSEAENESLENLFKVVDRQQISSNSKTPPTLIADQNGGAYSDISDDEEAPKLERHTSFATKSVPEEKQQPSKSLSTTQAPAPLVVIPPTAVVVEPIQVEKADQSVPKAPADLKIHAGKLETSKTNGTNSKKVTNNQMVSKQQAVIKQETCTSPKMAEKKPLSQTLTAVPYSYATFPLAPNAHISMSQGPVPMTFEAAGPLLYGGPTMFAFPVGTQPPINPPSMYFGMPLQQPPVNNSTMSHKIHELSETTTSSNKAAAQPSSNVSSINTGEIKKQQTDVKVHNRDEPNKSDPSRSPPIQRHLHTHHHTHSYPIMPTVDYAGFLASHNQQAAATMVGAFPPFPRK